MALNKKIIFLFVGLGFRDVSQASSNTFYIYAIYVVSLCYWRPPQRIFLPPNSTLQTLLYSGLKGVAASEITGVTELILSQSNGYIMVFAIHLIFAEESPDSDNNGSGANSSDTGSDDEESSTQNSRTFFSFTRIVSCNYTSQAGRTCSSCRRTLLCTANNIGIQRRCHGFRPYCNQGRCSYIPGSACNSTG